MLYPLPDTATFFVSPRDIKDGVENSCYRCPIALAASRFFQVDPKFELVDVYPDRIIIDHEDGLTSSEYALSPDAQDFIAAFDIDGPDDLEPIEVGITRSSNYIRLT